jgi:hypothetical protein
LENSEITQHSLKSILVKHAVLKVRTTNSIFKNLTKMGAKVLKLGWNETNLKGKTKTIWESTSSFNMFF